MKTVARYFFWSLFCLALLVGGDQLLCRMEPKSPSLKVAHQFYTDFRNRLLGIGQPRTIEAVIERQAEPTTSPVSPAGSTRFLYKDSTGQLQFADSLDDVPPPYRDDAKPMYP